MRILGLDTSISVASVAVSEDGRIVAEDFYPRQGTAERSVVKSNHAEIILPLIDSVLQRAGKGLSDVTGLAVSVGPGSFTGLRIGAAMAIALSRAARLPLYAVPTLAAVAEAWSPPEPRRVCATLDARRGRRYAALYEREAPRRWKLLDGPLDAGPEAVEALARAAPVVAPDGVDPAGVAVAICRLVAADPASYALASPADLELAYARPAVDAR